MSSIVAKILDGLTSVRGVTVAAVVFTATLPAWLPRAIDTVTPSRPESPAEAAPQTAESPPPAAAATTAPRPVVVLRWHGEDGGLYRGAVNPQVYADFAASQEAMLGGARRRQEAALALSVTDELDATFAPMEKRVAQYAEWAFNWWTSYIIAVDATSAAWTALWQGQATDMGKIIEDAVRTSVDQRYQDLVARPELTERLIRQGVLDVGTGLRRAMLAECATLDRVFTQFVREQVGDIERSLPTGGWAAAGRSEGLVAKTSCQRVVETMPAPDLTQLGIDKALASDGRVGEIVVRVTRPLVTGLVTAGISASSVAAALSGVGIPAAVVSAPAVVALVVKSSFTVVDYALSEIDESINRDTFEKAVLATLNDGRQQLERKVLALWLSHQTRLSERIMAELAGQHSVGQTP